MTSTAESVTTTVAPMTLTLGDRVLVHRHTDGRVDTISHMLGWAGNHAATLAEPPMPYSTGETVLRFADGQFITLPAGARAAKVA